MDLVRISLYFDLVGLWLEYFNKYCQVSLCSSLQTYALLVLLTSVSHEVVKERLEHFLIYEEPPAL